MTRFNQEAAEAARAVNPSLTIFDTGEMLQPCYQVEQYGPKVSYGAQPKRKTGTVDFDNDESATVLTIFAHPSALDDDTTLVQIDTLAGGKFKIMLNDGVLFNGDVEEKTSVERILDAYDAIETAWGDYQEEDEGEPRSPGEYEDHDDALTSLLHDLVSAIRGERTE